MASKEDNKKYHAFISYKREDEKWASWLQRKLEHYKIPIIVKKANPSLPVYVRPVFKDTTDLSGGVLEVAIDEALSLSRYLIVICSPRAAKSPWVCKEVQHFIDSGREEFIIPFIIEGQPNSMDIATECFPKNLRELTGSRELLGININEMGQDAAMVKVVARMFRLEFDTLWKRYEKDKRRKLYLWITLALMLVFTALIVSGLIYKKNLELERQNELIEEQYSMLDSTNVLITRSNDSLSVQHSRLLQANEKLNRQYELIEEQNIKLDSSNVLITMSKDSLAIQHSRLLQINEDLNKQKQMLNEQYENVRRANHEMKINHARYISRLIRSLTDEGEVYDAHRLSGEIYKRIISEGIDVPEVESAMRYSFSARPSFVGMNGNVSPCMFMPVKTFDADIYNCEFSRFDENGSMLLIYGSKGFGGVFDTRTGQMLHDLSLDINNSEITRNGFTLSRTYRYAALGVSDGNKNYIIVSDNETEEQRIFNADYGAVYMTFSPDERYLAYTSEYGLGPYTVIDVQNGKLVGSQSLGVPISSMVFSSDSKRLYFANILQEDLLICADIAKNKVNQLNVRGDNTSDSFKFNMVLCAENGKLYAGAHKKLSVINEADMKVIKTISGHDGSVTSAALYYEKFLVTGDHSGLVYIWDLESTPSLKQKLKLHDSEINHITIDDSGSWILTCSEDHKAKLLSDMRYHEPYVCEPIKDFEAVTCADTLSVIIKKENSICELSLIDGKVLWESEAPKGKIYSKVACHNGGELIAVPTSDQTILLYRDGKKGDVLQGPLQDVVDLSFNRDGSRLATVTWYDGELIIWDVPNNRVEKVLEAPSALGNRVNGVTFSNDGKYLLLFASSEVRLYDTSEWTYTSMKVISEEIQVAAISPNGPRAIICKDNQEMVIWDFNEERSLMNIRWQKVIEGAAFSHSGEYVAATSSDGWVKVWDVTTGEAVLEYNVCSDPCFNIQFLIDDSALICQDYNGFYLVGLYDMQHYVNYINNNYGSYPLTTEEMKHFYME